jgi:hypothetical protein
MDEKPIVIQVRWRLIQYSFKLHWESEWSQNPWQEKPWINGPGGPQKDRQGIKVKDADQSQCEHSEKIIKIKGRYRPRVIEVWESQIQQL